MRKRPRTDANQTDIIRAFERLGCSVANLSALGGGIPDLLVGYAGLCILVEVKDGAKPPSARKLTSDENAFRMTWKGGWTLAENMDDVQNIVSMLRERQKRLGNLSGGA